MSDEINDRSVGARLEDLLTSGLETTDAPLSERLADRVQRLARAELAPAPEAASAPWGLHLREALVPALLLSATVVRTADTAAIAARAFGGESPESPESPESSRSGSGQSESAPAPEAPR